MKICSECYSEEVMYYCCCAQVFLCENCSAYHSSHLLLSEDQDFDNVIECKSYQEQIEKRAKALEMQANEIFKEQERAIVSGVNVEPSSIRMIVNINKEMMNYLNPYYVYVCGIDGQICKLNLTDGSCEITQISVHKNLTGPFWVLEWANHLVILGGRIGLAHNKYIFVVNLENFNTETLVQLPEELYSFNPVIHNDILYIIGGNSPVPFKKSAPKNEILRINLSTGQYLESFYLDYHSYRLKSCIYDDSLLVLSEDNQSQLTFKPLNSHLGFQSIQVDLEITFASDISEFSKFLFLFNDNGVYCCQDPNTLKFDQIASFAHMSNLIHSCIWNQTHKPCFYNGKIYYFSLSKMICVGADGKVNEISYIF